MRIEVKEIFLPQDLIRIEARLALSPFRFYQPHPPRRINSLYFDSINLDSLEESIEGSSIRKKIRLRWYGSESKLTPATLEIKKKQGVLSWKELYAKQFGINPSSESWSRFINLEQNCNTAVHEKIRNLQPVSIVSYQRKYFSSFDHKVRITLDHNLQTFEQRYSRSPNLRFGRDHLNQLVLEAKVEAHNQESLDALYKQLPFSPKRFSKYCESLLPRNYI